MYQRSLFSTFLPIFHLLSFDNSHSEGVKWSLIVVLICLCVMISYDQWCWVHFRPVWLLICLYGGKKMSFQILCSYFNQIVFFYRVVWIIYTFKILILYQIYNLQIFFPFCRLTFHFIDVFLCFAEVFKFHTVSLVYFSFCCLCSWCPIQKQALPRQMSRCQAVLFILVIVFPLSLIISIHIQEIKINHY